MATEFASCTVMFPPRPWEFPETLWILAPPPMLKFPAQRSISPPWLLRVPPAPLIDRTPHTPAQGPMMSRDLVAVTLIAPP